jgi:hypothetical protein
VSLQMPAFRRRQCALSRGGGSAREIRAKRFVRSWLYHSETTEAHVISIWNVVHSGQVKASSAQSHERRFRDPYDASGLQKDCGGATNRRQAPITDIAWTSCYIHEGRSPMMVSNVARAGN